MASTSICTVHNYDIAIHVGIEGEGVCFHPDNADFSDPNFIDALKQAADAYPYVYALSYIQHQLEFDEPHLSTVVEGIKRGILPDNCIEDTVAYIESINDLRKKGGKNPEAKHGYVYVLSSDSGLYKIGKAKDYQDRIRTFSVKLPFMVAYDLVIKSNDYHALEQRLHQQFEHARVNGEWFALTPQDLDTIRAEYSGAIVEGGKE